MKQTFVIFVALAVFAGGMHAQGTYSPFGTQTSSGIASSIEQRGFNSMRMYETTVTPTYTPNTLSDIGATEVPALWHSPAIISDDDDLPPLIEGGEENKPEDPVIGYPVGDGTWVLVVCAMLFAVLRIGRAKRSTEMEK